MRPYDERLDHLLTQAARVFAERGYHATTMRDLSRASGMSLAGMYYYVQGKEELLEKVQERAFSLVLDGAERAIAGQAEPRERLVAFIRHHVTFFAAHMYEMKVLSHEAGSLTGERLARVNALKQRYVNVLLGLLGETAPDEVAAERTAAAYLLFGMMNWLYTWYDPGGTIDPERLAGLVTGIFLDGLLEARFPVHGG
ncbi:MAG TPA: TetR/AcrR family transcriptional regulator [Gemmatimonadales bacterium]|nr:TetR/AcrR family transcriptional regulator [Gemmatimonadales bacterium]